MSGIFDKLKRTGLGSLKNTEGTNMDPIKELTATIVDTVKEDAKDFLEQNKEARDFVEDRAKRLAELAWEYKTASDDAVKAAKKNSMAIVQQSIDNELTAVALHGEADSKATFKKVLNTATKTFVKVVPSLLSLI